jgi:hypothetical protein
MIFWVLSIKKEMAVPLEERPAEKNAMAGYERAYNEKTSDREEGFASLLKDLRAHGG